MSLHTPDTTLVRRIRVVGVGGGQQFTQAALRQLCAAALVPPAAGPALDVRRSIAAPTGSPAALSQDGAGGRGGGGRGPGRILERVGAVGDVAVPLPGGAPWAGAPVGGLRELADRWAVGLRVEPGVPGVQPTAR
ncbi:hypothetical protein [Streptomyces sp. FL07-04A]|uniref:hypothetical protein n=1 Tax=Streptomyces sp. FL07-04A TaxID=3028658 RepID=UPI0029ABDD0E|nr:hypothetical protein [Streptomyces sp. FL07-04A]MDX3580116.1 hypothetical protein [Streptomyces sp. FL07-04A]